MCLCEYMCMGRCLYVHTCVFVCVLYVSVGCPGFCVGAGIQTLLLKTVQQSLSTTHLQLCAKDTVHKERDASF